MKITCVCPTHGRPYHVEEAIESWRRQLWVESELLIVNDCPEQTLRCDVPGVRIINTREMFTDLSEKFNYAAGCVQTEFVAWWEDDDISRPRRLWESLSALDFLLAPEAYKQNRAWFWEHGDVVRRPVNLFFGGAMFKRAAWRGATPGQPADKSAWENMTNVCEAVEHYPCEDETFFVYRWGGTGHHDSAVRGNNLDRFKSFRFAVTHDPRFVRGTIDLRPRWHHDYELQVRKAIAAGKGKLT